MSMYYGVLEVIDMVLSAVYICEILHLLYWNRMIYVFK